MQNTNLEVLAAELAAATAAYSIACRAVCDCDDNSPELDRLMAADRAAKLRKVAAQAAYDAAKPKTEWQIKAAAESERERLASLAVIAALAAKDAQPIRRRCSCGGYLPCIECAS